MGPRLIGKAFLAGGFLVAVFGMTEENPIAVKSGLGLVAAGIVAMGYGLYRSLVPRAHLPAGRHGQSDR